MENHRSVSIFKAYQKYLQDPCFTKYGHNGHNLSKQQRGCRKGYNT